MKLLSNIINELMDEDISLESVLLKTKIFASRTQNRELKTWVDNELNGYKKEDDLPEYRISKALITGTFDFGNNRYKNAVIPLPLIEGDSTFTNFLKNLEKVNFNQSVSSLENLVKKDSLLKSKLPSPALALIENFMIKNVNFSFRLHSAEKTVEISYVAQILTQIKSKLLDFMLKIEEEFGEQVEIKELIKEKEKVGEIMSQTINIRNGDYNNFGENSQNNIVKNGGEINNPVLNNNPKLNEFNELFSKFKEELTNSELPKDEQTEIIENIELYIEGGKKNNMMLSMLTGTLGGLGSSGLGLLAVELGKSLVGLF